MEVAPEGLVSLRHERLLEDVAIDAESILIDPSRDEAAALAQVDLLTSLFRPGGMLA